jgi:hypothetical protein
MTDPEARLRQAVVREIVARIELDRAVREAAAAGMRHREIAAVTGMSNARIHRIIAAHPLSHH